jgi:hypothetical protein
LSRVSKKLLIINNSIVQMAFGITSALIVSIRFRELTNRKFGIMPPLKNIVRVIIIKKCFLPKKVFIARG